MERIFFHKSISLNLFICYLEILILSFSFTTKSFANQNQAKNQEPSQYIYTPSFRSGHNLGILFSTEYTNWSANQKVKPSLNENNNTKITDLTIDPAQSNNIVFALFFRYTYHINIISNFGFFLGSTSGFIFPNGSYGDKDNFYPGFGIALPTALVGLTLGVSQNMRLLSGAEYGAIWYPTMTIHTQSPSNIQKDLAAVPHALSAFIGIDNFLTRNTALTFNVGFRKTWVPCIDNCNSTVYLNTLEIESKSYFAQLGINWVVGDLN